MRARRWWGWLGVPVYAVGLAVKDGLRRVGVLRTRSLGWPVVSVGSLSAGGAGKTPVVIALAEVLTAQGWHVDVLTRGYGRDSSDDTLKDFAAQVMPDVDDAAAWYGDEPVLIASRTGVPVWVGGDRYAAGVMAEERAEGIEAGSSTSLRNDKQKSGQQQGQEQQQQQRQERQQGRGQEQQGQEQRRDAGVLRFAQNDTSRGDEERRGNVELEDMQRQRRGIHLLDDGFQHRGLGRLVDVVLVTAEDLEDALLPAGNRREPLQALRRADVVVLREEEFGRVEVRVRRWMSVDAQVWVVRRELRLGSAKEAVGSVVGFCAIARPEGFWGMLRAAGCEVVETVEFGDHHRYGMVDVERLVKVAQECGATGLITTEKDAVKLTAAMRERLETVGPLVIAGLNVTFVDEAQVVRDLESRMGEGRRR